MKAKRFFMLGGMNKLIYLLAIVVCLSACKHTDSTLTAIENININFDNIIDIDINKGEKIFLETSSNSLLSNLDKLIFCNNKIFVQSRKTIIAFDICGNYLFNLGGIGRAENEYLSMNSFFKYNEQLCIYDWQARKVLTYNPNGQYLSSKHLQVPKDNGVLFPSDLLVLSDGNYIALNTFRGESESTPEFSLLNNNLEYLKNYNGLNLINGAMCSDLLVGYQNTVIYNRLFSDTLYRVGNSSYVEAAYYVDFNRYKLKESAKKGKDYIDIIQESNNPEFINNIATLIKYKYETESTLMFIFGFRQNIHFVVYNKISKKAQTFQFIDSSNKYKPEMFISYQQDDIYISASDINNITSNPILIKINSSLFK